MQQREHSKQRMGLFVETRHNYLTKLKKTISYLTDLLFSGRVDGGEGLSADGVDKLVVDEELFELDFWNLHCRSVSVFGLLPTTI